MPILWSGVFIKCSFALSPLPRKRGNGLGDITVFWVFFRSLVNFEDHCRDKIHTILGPLWSKSIIFLNYQIENQESVRQKSVSDCSELSCLHIRSNWMFWVVKKNIIWCGYQFYSLNGYILDRPLMDWPQP